MIKEDNFLSEKNMSRTIKSWRLNNSLPPSATQVSFFNMAVTESSPLQPALVKAWPLWANLRSNDISYRLNNLNEYLAIYYALFYFNYSVKEKHTKNKSLAGGML
ncbi:hypothetical protein [Serratia aquatilis]|uniref:Uncharacterized protein n=1 Tax=Serratia aquatilis TaxID=1737515 RepID=A0ABV6EI29_9GAMM